MISVTIYVKLVPFFFPIRQIHPTYCLLKKKKKGKKEEEKKKACMWCVVSA